MKNLPFPRGLWGHARAGSALAVTLAIMMILCLRGGPVGAAEPAKDTSKPKYRVLFSNDLFNNVNHNDVLVAFKVWIETVLKNRNYPMEAEIDSYDGLDEAEKRIQEGTVDLVIFNSIDYLQTSQTNQLDAVFVAERQKKTMFDDYLLVSRRDRNFTSLADLRGKSVIFFDYGAKLGRLWMDVTLGESGLGSAGEFFGSISDATKATSIVLPVFFGKADACVVGRSSLETMQELNPQLATQLQVLTNSVCLPESVICLPKHYAWDREAALRGLAELDTEPRGQQILLIFKINKLDPFRPEQLDGLRDLKARYDRLSPPTAPQKAVAASTGTPKP